MGTTIYLIRHGETEGADACRYKGHIDVPLSANGIEQIKKLSSFLSGKGPEIKAIYCSGLSRANKTAKIIGEPFGLKPLIVDELKERNFGEWEGMSFDEIGRKWPDAFNAWAEDPLRFSPMGGESTLALRDRVMPAFNKIMENHEGEDLVIVSHGGVTRVILCEMLGIPLENIFRIEQDFGAMNVIEMWDYPVVKQINYTI